MLFCFFVHPTLGYWACAHAARQSRLMEILFCVSTYRWKPTRSPAAIAAEAAAREAAAAAAAAEAANQRAEVDAAVRAQAADDAQAELAQPAAIGVD